MGSGMGTAWMYLLISGIVFLISSGIFAYFMIVARQKVFRDDVVYSKGIFWIKMAQIILILFLFTVTAVWGMMHLPISPHTSRGLFWILSIIAFYVLSVLLVAYSVRFNFRSLGTSIGRVVKKPLVILNILLYVVVYSLGMTIIGYIVQSVFGYFMEELMEVLAKFGQFGSLGGLLGGMFVLAVITSFLATWEWLIVGSFIVITYFVYKMLSRKSKFFFWIYSGCVALFILLLHALTLGRLGVSFFPVLIGGYITYTLFYLAMVVNMSFWPFLAHLYVQAARFISDREN